MALVCTIRRKDDDSCLWYEFLFVVFMVREKINIVII